MIKDKIIWTRSVDDWETDLNILSAGLEDIVHLPCIRTQAIAQPIIPEIPPNQPIVAVLASIKAVQYSLANSVVTAILRRAQRIFALGAKTTSYLQQHGFTVETNPKWRGMIDLANDLLPLLSQEELVLAPGPKTRVMDLAALIQEHGNEFVAIDVYETSAGLRGKNDDMLLQTDIEGLQRDLSGVVCFASPSAVTGFTKWLDTGLFGLKERLRVICIGETTLRSAVEYFDDCRISPVQSTESMFAMALQLLNH